MCFYMLIGSIVCFLFFLLEINGFFDGGELVLGVVEESWFFFYLIEFGGVFFRFDRD